MEGQKDLERNRNEVFSDRQIIAIVTVLLSLGVFEYKYDLLEEYLSPSVVAENQKEMKKALKACMDEADGILTKMELSDCVEDKFEENTDNFREIICKIDAAGEGNCDLATLF